MAAKRKSNSSRDQRKALIERLKLVCDTLWQGKQFVMARDLDLTPATISRILTGKIDASTLLVRLSSSGLVNSHWLHTGQGFPDLDRDGGVGSTQFLPVSKTLLATVVNQKTTSFSEFRYPIISSYFAPTRYWYQVPQEQASIDELKFLPADMVLIETNPIFFGDSRLIHDRIFVVKLAGEKADPQFAKIEIPYFQDSPYHHCGVRYEVFVLKLFPTNLGQDLTRPLVDLIFTFPETPTKIPPARKGVPQIGPEQICGIVLRLDRVWGNLVPGPNRRYHAPGKEDEPMDHNPSDYTISKSRK